MAQDQEGPSQIIQFYPFEGNDIQKVYEASNTFTRLLAGKGIFVPREDITRTHKFYPDYHIARTILDVCVRVSPDHFHPQKPFETVGECYTEALKRLNVYTPESTSDDFDPFLNSDDLP